MRFRTLNGRAVGVYGVLKAWDCWLGLGFSDSGFREVFEVYRFLALFLVGGLIALHIFYHVGAFYPM